MKISSLSLERFKQFTNYRIDFSDPVSNKPLDLILLVGENGSGKSSILQVIAATLATATGQIKHPSQLEWPGFVYENISAAHKGFSNAQINVEFSQEEILAVREYFSESDYATSEDAIRPNNLSPVELLFTNAPTNERPVVAFQGAAALFQFHGREYASHMLKRGIRRPNIFKRVGGVFWYHEQRTAASLSPLRYISTQQPNNLDDLRQMIGNWNIAGTTFGEQRMEKLRKYYSILFPERRFSRIGDTFGPEPPAIFFMYREHEYELEEFSAGERALFPILIDFINWDICNSVVLIDELELHLHPPLQQKLLEVLPDLGENNQYIITTHSDWIANLIPVSRIKRIDVEIEPAP